MTNNSNAGTVLNWNGKTIKSLKDLRNNYTPELLLEAHMNQDLYNWLDQHYYENEAQSVSFVKISDSDCLKKLCRILKIELPENRLTSEEAAALEEKKAALREITSDDNIIENAAFAAMNQEELAELLNRGCTVIYLCDNSFSIPLSKPNVKYIGVGKAEIENPYTRKQYKKSGIEIENISLPEETSEYRDGEAHIAALNNGFDDFADYHSPLTTALHNQLKCKQVEMVYLLPNSMYELSELFTCRSDCDKARKKAIEEAYHKAEQYFDTSNHECVSKEAIEFYTECIESVFNPSVVNSLHTLCKIMGKESIFSKVKEMIFFPDRKLRRIFEDELNENYRNYKMYDMEYYIDKTCIEKHDNRISPGGILKLIETVFADNIHYTINNAFQSIDEMEEDLNTLAESFFTTAYLLYEFYISDLENLIEEIGKGLPPFRENETVAGYLSRMCVEKSL